MTEKQLFHALRDIDTAFVLAAAPKEKAAIPPKRWPVVLAAAMFSIILLTAIALPALFGDSPPPLPPIDTDKAEHTTEKGIEPETEAKTENDSPAPPSSENTDINIEPETEAETETETEPEEYTVENGTPELNFENYQDFLTFGQTGKLDPAKYENAQELEALYRFDDGSFLDVKKLLALAPESKGWRVGISMYDGRNNHYSYFVYSPYEDRSFVEYIISVRKTNDTTLTAPSATRIESLSEMTEKGSYLYTVGDVELLYNKSYQKYPQLTIFYKGFYINIQPQYYYTKPDPDLKDQLGDLVYGIFFEDQEAYLKIFKENFAEAVK